MREAALEIARGRADWAPSLVDRIAMALRALARRRTAVRDLARLRTMDAHRLADIGLRPHDLVGLDPNADPLEATRRLAGTARRRSRELDFGDRWGRR